MWFIYPSICSLEQTAHVVYFPQEIFRSNAAWSDVFLGNPKLDFLAPLYVVTLLMFTFIIPHYHVVRISTQGRPIIPFPTIHYHIATGNPENTSKILSFCADTSFWLKIWAFSEQREIIKRLYLRSVKLLGFYSPMEVISYDLQILH